MRVAPTDSSVLVSGETGSGKELVAHAIHKRSRRSQHAFVSVNCAALAPSLISSELSLRERQDDVLMLLEYFVDRFAQKMGKHFKKIDKRTVELFRSYPWPGNIRELQNVVERSVIVSSDGVFSMDAAWLSKDPLRVSLPQQPEPADANEDARRERQIIEDALAGSRGRVSGANGAAAVSCPNREFLVPNCKRPN